MSLDQLKHAAATAAYNPNAGVKARHKIANKARKWKKPRNVVKTAVSVAGAAIPIPGVANVVDFAVGRAVDKIEDRVRSKKLLGASDPASEVKHAIKNLNVSELDSARYKVTDQIKAFNALMAQTGSTKEPCELSYNLMYRRYRAGARNDILRAQAEVFLQVARDILEWCDRVDRSLADGESNMMAMVTQIAVNQHPPYACSDICIRDPAGQEVAIAKTGYLVI